jgi:membrane protease YdiL (CAAX protease family)
MSPIPVILQPMFILLGACALATPLVMWWGRTSFVQAGWRRPGWRGMLAGLGWGILLATAAIAWLRYLLHTGNYLPLPLPAAPQWTDWVLLVVAVPLLEEPLFRGAMFGGLQRTWQPFWAFTLSATAYVACHPDEPWLAFLFTAGLGYAAAMRQGRSLAAPVLAHMLTAAALLLGRIHPAAVGALPLPAFGWAAAGALLLLIISASLPDA